jgi:molecular chaperone DnaJ
VLINVDEHALFRRRGADLLCEAPVTISEAALGTELPVPTLERSTRIRIPPGTPSGKVFRLAGRGLPGTNRTGRGDLHVQIFVEVPTELSSTQKQALETLSEHIDLSAYPRRSAYSRSMNSSE